MSITCPKMWCHFFKAIHDRHRQHVLELLAEHGQLNATEIVKRLKLSQPTVSHHLKILHEAKLINTLKQGKEVFYSINQKSIVDCCGGFIDKFAK